MLGFCFLRDTVEMARKKSCRSATFNALTPDNRSFEIEQLIRNAWGRA
jgi:hypothetical protein